MIFDFPRIRHVTREVAVFTYESGTVGYRHNVTEITRRPWLRLIWSETEKTIMVGRWVIHLLRHRAESAD